MVSIVIGIPLGIIAAVKRNTLSDYITSVLSVAGVAMPSFWTGILLILLFAITLGILPASGYMPFTENPKQNLLSLILPAFTIGFSFSATITRQTRSAMLEVFNQDYIMTARAKGLLEKKVIWKHALKNAIIPVLAVIGMHMGRMISGAVVTEQVFMLPGMGKALVDSIIARDYPVVMAIVLMVVLGILIFNTLLDILYIILDPRISRSMQSSE
jgi:peptide/nickel transport system permease protein